MEQVFVNMRAQVDKKRVTKMNMEEYLEFREEDVGIGFMSTLMLFSMKLCLSDDEHKLAEPIVKNYCKHISVVNDICSYDKEARAAAGGYDCGMLCNAVPVMMELGRIGVDSAKRILWAVCREWETRHVELVEELKAKIIPPGLQRYIEGLEYQMGGNETWSRSTPRYNDADHDSIG